MRLHPLSTALLLWMPTLALACVVASDDDGDDDTGSSTGNDPTVAMTMTDPTLDPASSGTDPTNNPTEVEGSSSGSSVDDTTTSGATTTGGDDPIDYAGEMNGYRWELPCEDPSLRDTCAWDPALLDGAIEGTPYTLRRE